VFTGAVNDAGYRPVLVSAARGTTAELFDQVDTAVAARPDALSSAQRWSTSLAAGPDPRRRLDG
jgi:hypothetical protein